jgi:uncharacterized protein (DUF1330 family)
MAKGYWIARVDVKNEEGYKPYAAANPAIFKKYGGRLLVRGGKFDAVEGDSRARKSSSSFLTMPPRSAAISRPNIRKTSKCACHTPHSN